MKDDDVYNKLMKRIKTGITKMKNNSWTKSDYFFNISDYFNSIEPSKGIHIGQKFNFKKDAEELKHIAIKELDKENK